jgi:hypothetical protein
VRGLMLFKSKLDENQNILLPKLERFRNKFDAQKYFYIKDEITLR